MSPEPEVLVSGRKTNKSAVQIYSNPNVHLPGQKMLGEAGVIQLSSWHSDQQQQLCALAFAEKTQGEKLHLSKKQDENCL